MSSFLSQWAEAALTTLGFFWTAFWAFCLGYLVSSAIQVFVTEERMRRRMGGAGPNSVALGTSFGFLSSSCSFAAFSTTRALFQKGAGLVPALAFLLSSTNLVIELGILIYLFLSWQFVVGEYVGGLLIIGVVWALVALTLPAGLEGRAREHAGEATGGSEGDPADWRRLIRSVEGWRRVARRYFMEWRMVWKDVVFGFTVAGIIAVFVPAEFFRTLFVGSGGDGPAWQIVLQALIGPLAAFFTFIGSMGNIPLAAVLFSSGVGFAGVMAFIFSDLVVFPVLRISAQYFGLRMALYIVGVFLVSLVLVSVALHYGFAWLGALPDAAAVTEGATRPSERFQLDYTFLLDLGFALLSGGLAVLAFGRSGSEDHGGGSSGWDRALLGLAWLSVAWLAGGVVLGLLA